MMVETLVVVSPIIKFWNKRSIINKMGFQSIFTRRKLILAMSVFVLLSAAWFFLSYSWLTIYNLSSKSAEVSLYNKDGEIVERFTLSKNPKTLFLKKDFYSLRASSGSSVTSRNIQLKPLWFNKLKISLRHQKASVFIGKSQQPCVREVDNQTIFASCSPYGRGSFIELSSGKLLNNKSEMPDQTSLTSGSLKKYQDGFLYARSANNRLILSKRGLSRQKILSIQKFGGEINNQSLATMEGSSAFAVYDNKNQELLIFDDMSDKEPLRVKVKDNKIDPNFGIKLAINENYVYFISYDGRSHIKKGSKKISSPEIIIYDIHDGSLKNKFSIPDEWLVRRVETKGDKALLDISNIKNATRELQLIYGHNKPILIDNIKPTAQDICWKDTNNFYYLADAGRSIYEYSLDKKASFMIYGSLSNIFISNIQCSDDSLYFVFDLMHGTRRVENKDRGYYFYKVTDEDFSGTRIEDVIGFAPIFTNIRGVTFSASLGINNTIKIHPISFGEDLQSMPSKKLVLKSIKNNLKEEGVDIKNLRFKVSSSVN